MSWSIILAPASLERLGFSYEVLQQINPGIVQVVMPGWGLTGPLKTWVAWGWQLLAYTGIMRLWGYPDSPMETRCKIAWPDRVGSVTMALGVLAALEYQARTGKGQFIEAGMLEAQGAMMGPAILDYTVNGNEWDAMGYEEILGAAVRARTAFILVRETTIGSSSPAPSDRGMAEHDACHRQEFLGSRRQIRQQSGPQRTSRRA